LKHLSRARLKEISSRFADLTMGVVGDVGLDGYWYADMTRSFLSRETPHFPRPVVREAYSPGAGANVAYNLKALGVGEVVAFSIVGADWRGMIFREEMSRWGIVVDELIISPERSTTTFIKPILMGYDSQQEDARLDFENAEPLPQALEKALVDALIRHLPNLDGLIIADQLDMHGVVTDHVREALNNLAANHADVLFVADSRQHIGLFRDMVLKPNRLEAVTAICPERDPCTVKRDDLAQIGQILEQRGGRPVFITLSDEGVIVCAEGTHGHLPAAPVRPSLDPVGAGDTFIAALAATLAVGATPWEAGVVANLAAAVVVEKLNQTGTASLGEILARFDLAQAEEGAD
jgi:rfaE bifunctional protein kinase chain/domain